MARYFCAKGENPNYWVHLQCNGHNLEIICDMPETIALGVTSDWESRLPYSLSSLLDNATGSAIGAGIATVIGSSPQYQALSYQMWMGTTPIEIPMTILFNSETSGRKDVYEPISHLLAACLPRNGSWMGIGGMLMPPGPFRGDDGGASDSYAMNIRFGKMMEFIGCILVSANESLDTRLDKEGFPISGQVECTFRTGMVYGHSDWLKAMKLIPNLGNNEPANEPNTPSPYSGSRPEGYVPRGPIGSGQ